MSGRVLSKFSSADLSLSEFDESFDFDNSGRLLTVYVTSDTALTEEISISLDSKDGTNYDTLIADRIMDSETCYVYSSAGMVALSIGDKVRVQVTNANGVGSVYVTVKLETSYH